MSRNNGTSSELPVNRAAGSIRIAIATKQGYSLSVVTDLAEVFQLGTAKVEENLDFRRYLSAKHYSDKPFQILASEVQKQVDCTACANCCRHSVVPVSELEIQTVAEYLGATREAVTRLYTVPDPDAPALRILRSSMEGCVFLDGNLCMIYETRPKACRDFPHIAVGTHSLGGRQSSLARWVALCPIIFNALESYKHLTGYHPLVLLGNALPSCRFMLRLLYFSSAHTLRVIARHAIVLRSTLIDAKEVRICCDSVRFRPA